MSAIVQQERRLKEVHTIYLRVLRKNASVFQELQRQAKNSIEYCRQKGFDEPKFARRVLEACDQQLTFITCREAEIRALREGKEEGQMTLRPQSVRTRGTDPGEVRTHGTHPDGCRTPGAYPSTADEATRDDSSPADTASLSLSLSLEKGVGREEGVRGAGAYPVPSDPTRHPSESE